MPKMIFVERDGSRREVDAPLGDSVLAIARRHDIGLVVEPAMPGGELAVERLGTGQFALEAVDQIAHRHLLTHAAFKALLFLAAGAVIHAVGTTLMSGMGGLRRDMPLTFWCVREPR